MSPKFPTDLLLFKLFPGVLDLDLRRTGLPPDVEFARERCGDLETLLLLRPLVGPSSEIVGSDVFARLE